VSGFPGPYYPPYRRAIGCCYHPYYPRQAWCCRSYFPHPYYRPPYFYGDNFAPYAYGYGSYYNETGYDGDGGY
jgi:hypothetical protein